MPKVSVIIAARGERHLPRMVAHLLTRLTGDFELLVGFDGPPYTDLPDDEGRQFVHAYHFDQRGLKPTINELAQRATGEYLLKLDSHCAISEGLDETLQQHIEPNWMVVPRFYTLDETLWDRNLNKRHNDYWNVGCPLTDRKGYRFQASGYWFERTAARAHIGPLDESLTHHGSCWFTPRRFFLDTLGGMQADGYGANYMEPADLGFRTWMLGGQVMCNKAGWYAHLHQDHRQRGYPIDWAEVNRSYLWTANHWMRNRAFWPLVERFMPMPTWPADWQARQAEYERVTPWPTA